LWIKKAKRKDAREAQGAQGKQGKRIKEKGNFGLKKIGGKMAVKVIVKRMSREYHLSEDDFGILILFV